MVVPFYFTHWSSLAVISFHFNLRKLFILFSFNLEVLREVTLPDTEASPSSLIWFLLNWLSLTFPDHSAQILHCTYTIVSYIHTKYLCSFCSGILVLITPLSSKVRFRWETGTCDPSLNLTSLLYRWENRPNGNRGKWLVPFVVNDIWDKNSLRTSFFLKFLFCMGVWSINKQCCDSFRWTVKRPSHTYTCIPSPPNSPPFNLSHNIEQSSMCYIVGPCCLSILNVGVYTCPWDKNAFK